MLQIQPDFFSPEGFIKEYEALGGLHNQRIIEVLIQALAIIPFIKNSYAKIPTDISIRISNSEIPSAEGNDYSINISLGIIKHCISAPCMPLDEIFPSISHIDFNYSSLAALSLSWIIAHEYFHIIKLHNEVARTALSLSVQPYDNSISNALEHDADLMAVAALYRFLQVRLSGVLNDLEIRSILACSIFFPLRTFPQGGTDDVHSPMPQRLFHIFHKLIWLPQGQSEKFSASEPTEHTKERFAPLFQVFIKCEEYYEAIEGSSEYNLITLFQELWEDGKALEIVESWHAIKPIVEELIEKKTNTCVFCGTNESIIVPTLAPWIARKLNIGPSLKYISGMASGNSLEKDFSSPSRPDLYQLTSEPEYIDRICASCKIDWFDTLDSATRPLLEKLIDGEKPVIDEDDARLLSVYMCVIAVLHEYSDPNPDNRYIPAHYKEKLRKNEIPQNWIVALQTVERNSDYDIISHCQGLLNRPFYTICNIHLGCFYAQLICLINFDYPLILDSSNCVVIHPPASQSDLKQIHTLTMSELNGSFDKLHLLFTKWATDQMVSGRPLSTTDQAASCSSGSSFPAA